MAKCWLMKSEPGSYSIDDLARDGKTAWEGVRNYQARNFMRDEMRVGDPVLYYHSNADPTGVAGLARVASAARPDRSALDPRGHYFDEKASEDDPRWCLVDIEFVEKLPRVVTLDELRRTPGLEKMLVINKSRLSVQPVTQAEYDTVVALARAG